jgi:prepilin-type N-terminal cleavage/methylation domain-containing protein
MILSKNRGFSLIELMIVIAIIGILVAVALPQFASMSEDAKKTKARQDCDTIVQAVTRFNAIEGVALRSLDELAGKYITNIKELRDPWGNPYYINTGSGFVFSMGPDGQSPYNYAAKGAAPTKKDDIKVSFIGELMLCDAVIAEDVGFSFTAPLTDTADSLILTFNKTVDFASDTDVLFTTPMDISAANKVTITVAAATAGPFDPGGGIFDWYVGTSSEANKVASGTKILHNGKTFGPAPGVAVTQSVTMYQSSDDSREIIIDIDHHSVSGIVPNYHHINVSPNLTHYFWEDGSFSGTVLDTDNKKLAKRAGTAVKIRRE